jgi:GTP-binding protein
MDENKYLISTATYISSNVSWKKISHEKNHEYAFIGRSNVGKSSLINLLFNNKSLAKTSKKPGKTKFINLFLINKSWNVVDLPGYGYAKVSKTDRYAWTKNTTDYLLNRKNLVNVFVLIDSNIPPQKIDIEFINYLGESMVPFSIVFTKIDKSKKIEVATNISTFLGTLSEYWEELPPTFETSIKTKEGKEDILEYIFELNKEVKLEN